MIGLARDQLALQSAAADNIDLKAMGLLGFDGALIAANVAAKGVIHRLWWVPLPGLAISIVLCLAVAVRYSFLEGPSPEAFYAAYGGQSPAVALVQLLADLGEAYRRNQHPLTRKRQLLTCGLTVLLLTFVAAAVAWLTR